jgi:GDP-mannose 6-dehydrogenase
LKVAVFGLGYVGAVTAACLTRDGHTVAGVDVNPDKVALVAAGRSPFVEPGLDELMATGVACGRLTATTDASAAALASDICLISVGTPNTESGLHDTTQVMTVCEQIAGALAGSPSERIIVLRSTVPPGTLNLCRELLESSGCDGSIHFAFNPEFLREGSAISDYNDPPYTVIGTDDPAAAAAVRELYARVGGSVFTVAPAVAELVKSVANAWHATKITFANEVGRLATAFGVDGREVMDVIARDTKLNVSPAYMRPGYAYGGSCLPKDTRSLIAWGREFELLLPLLESLPASNEAQIDTAVGGGGGGKRQYNTPLVSRLP